MENILKYLGRLGLLLTILPSFLYLAGMMELATMKLVMIIGTILWLVIAPVIQKLNKKSGIS